MDLFAKEQKIYDEATARVEDVRSGAPFDFEAFATISKEYGKLLNQIRMATRFTERAAVDLFESNLDPTDKVYFDALTGMYNRRFMEESLERIIKSLSRSNGVLSIMILDVDFFRKYNDTYGQKAGDACLKAVAETLSNAIAREDDFVARYDGGEFVVVLPHTDENGAHVTAGRLLRSVVERNILHEENDVAGCITVSIGVTTAMAKHTHKAGDYIRRADEALYISKRNGRNRYTCASFTDAAAARQLR